MFNKEVLRQSDVMTKDAIEKMQQHLGELQRTLKNAALPVQIIIEGWNAAGKGTLINNVMLPLDPRNLIVYDMHEPDSNEAKHFFLWRYYSKMPKKGSIVLFNRSYYSDILTMYPKNKDRQEKYYKIVRDYEKMLVDNGVLVVKCFLHISRKQQRLRLKYLASQKETKWRVTSGDLKENRHYSARKKRFDRMLKETHTAWAPWLVISGESEKEAKTMFFKALEERIQNALENLSAQKETKLVPLITNDCFPYKKTILENFDAEKVLDNDTYKYKLKCCQEKMRLLEHQIYRYRIPVIVAFEGFDAGGKGGAIKRLCENLDPRGYRVYPTAAPNDEERARIWLWRFLKNLPKAGHVSIFDRTWYGRVLVEPIEGLLTEDEYRRAYNEINTVEKQLAKEGTVIIKFWMQITKDEQERRFLERQNTPEKQYKITDEDWRNREKWDAYLYAADKMIHKTSTKYAPWTIVAGNDKHYARIQVLETVIQRIEKAIKDKKSKG